jgi:hypothetical protein
MHGTPGDSMSSLFGAFGGKPGTNTSWTVRCITFDQFLQAR